MNYNRNQIDGNLAVRNDSVIGGDQTVRGNQQINGDLQVSGAIVGAEVSSKDMGLHLTESALKSAVPSPEVGMYAAVGSGFPAALYRCDTAGTWTATGEEVNYNAPTAAALQAMKAAASILVGNETTRAEFAEDAIKTLLSTETKERKASNDETAQMLRRLSVFMTDHHHHCLDPDWLWRELLLSASLDTENDILTLLGIKYKLTRYIDTPTRTGAYTWGDVTATLSYNGGSAIAATTESVSPTLVVVQKKIFDMSDGSTETEDITLTSADYSATYASHNAADADKVGSTGIVTFGVNTDTSTSPSVQVDVTVTAHGTTASATATASQSKAAVKAYYGSSADIPTEVDTTNDVTLKDGATAILDTRNSTDHCIWVAIPTGANYELKSVINNTNDAYTMTTDETKISGYTLYYHTANKNILDYMTITFKSKE